MPGFIPNPLHHYELGERVRKDDMNAIQKRLSRTERMSGTSPIRIDHLPDSIQATLTKKITEFDLYELVEDLPPYGAAKAAIVLYRPTDSVEVDWQNPTSPSGDKEFVDESGFVRGTRIGRTSPSETDRLSDHTIVVYDQFGCGGWIGDRGLCYQNENTYDGRYFFLPDWNGDQCNATLNYSTKHTLKSPADDPPGVNYEYAPYRISYNSNTRLFIYQDDETVGNLSGNGKYIQIVRKGIYHVIATLSASRLTGPSGADIAEKITNASSLEVRLEHFCSTSWNTLDSGEIDALPKLGAAGSITLQGKFQACYDYSGIRVVVVLNGGDNGGNWQLDNGNLHIERKFHQHFRSGGYYVLEADGDPSANILDQEGGYLEENEVLHGDYDKDWTSAMGDQNKHNSGYPPDASNPNKHP